VESKFGLNCGRLIQAVFAVRHAMLLGMSVEEIYELTGIDPWFLDKMQQLLQTEKFLKRTPLKQLTKSKCMQ